ncbi:MAG TPA: hypothetical protein VG797_02440 [Phycisphaerales bacterium]|nr:hypothetical protein [Phycisphaerales bacterium]
MSHSRCVIAAVAAGALLSFAGAAQAGLIESGTYRLHNHPDGAERPPNYGLRLDELYDETSGHDVFTFDFDHAQSLMQMDVSPTTIHIYGHVFGGRDVGSGYANDGYRGVYEVDFTYTQVVQLVPGDDDYFVAPPVDTHNYGYMIAPDDTLISLRDGHYTGPDQRDFRLGDEDNDAGHRGYNGISGWGWLFFALPGHEYQYTESSDWLFTATLTDVPAPGAAFVLGAPMVLGFRRRRA